MVFDLTQYRDKTAVLSEEGNRLTYGALHAFIGQIGQALQKGNLAFCLCHNSIGSLAGYLAFLEYGVPAVMLEADKAKQVIDGLIEVYQPRYIWLPVERKSDFEGMVIAELEGYYMIERQYTRYEIHSEIALLLTTSGSTGSPKLVKLTAKNLLSNASSIAEYLNIDDNERPITSLPMYYSYGLSVINSHLLKGATLLLTDRAVIQKEFWAFAKKEEATSISGVPYTYEILRRLRIFRMDLPKLKTMTQAGGKLNAEIVKEYIQKSKASGRKFIVMYGQTEATARMSYLPFEYAEEKYQSIGLAIPGGKFSIIDQNGNEITDFDVDGELVYSGPNVSLGYAECIEDLSKPDENGGLLYTGDVACRDTDGFYYITGRMKRFIKIFGNRVNLDSVEQMIKNITTSCACVGVDDKLTVFVTENGFENRIISFISSFTGLNPSAFAVKVISVLPISPSGKIQYAELLKLTD